MIRPLSLAIGLRYIRAKRRTHFISFITLSSMIGIALGVAALITVLSVMNGFERELRDRILSMVSHVTVYGADQRLRDWESVAAELRDHARVEGVAPYIRSEAMLSAGGRVNGTLLRGILPEEEGRVAAVGQQMTEGQLSDLVPGEFGIVLGHDLARSLGVAMGDRVTLVSPQSNVTPAGVMPRLKRFTVTGIFQVGMYEYDSAMSLVHLGDAQTLFRLGDDVTGVRARLDELMMAPRVTQDLSRTLPRGLFISDWTREHANLFRAIRIEKTAMFIILTLIVAVAAFNIVSTLVMVVTDKRADIAILRTLGTTPRAIMGIFMIQGTLVGLIGTALGTGLGLLLAFNVETVVAAIERLLGFQFLAADVYYITDLPSDVRAGNVALTAIVAFSLSVLATLYPAWRAARTEPADALRYD